MHDGDCREISTSDLANEEELTRRPNGFLSAAKKTAEVLKKIELEHNLKIYYSTIKSKGLPGKPKGIDDLYNAFKDKERKDITKQLLSLKENSRFFITHHISNSTRTLVKWSNDQMQTPPCPHPPLAIDGPVLPVNTVSHPLPVIPKICTKTQ